MNQVIPLRSAGRPVFKQERHIKSVEPGETSLVFETADPRGSPFGGRGVQQETLIIQEMQTNPPTVIH